MEVTPGYKQTEVGVIPEQWGVETLGDVGRWFSGGTPSMANDSFWNGDIPWVSAKDMKVSRIYDSQLHVTEEAIGNGTRLAPPAAVLMVVRGMILAHTLPVALAKRPVAFNQDMKALTTFDDVHSEFVLLWLQANAQKILGIASESTHGTKRITSEDLLAVKLALPPKPEQRAIAEALSDVDGLLGGLDRLIAKKRDLKQATMQQLLTGGTRLPGFDAEWKRAELGEVATIRNTKIVAGTTSPETPCVELDCIGQGDGQLLFTVPATGASMKYSFKRSDVLFGRLRAYLRKVWLATFDGVCSTEIWPLIPRGGGLAPEFLHLLVQTRAFVDAAGVSYGTHMPRSDWSVLRRLAVLLPPVREQFAIAGVLSDMDAELAALEARRDKTRAIKQAMMQELLTGRTRLV